MKDFRGNQPPNFVKNQGARRVIELRDVQRTFVDGSHHLPVLRGVNWFVADGESVAIMGRSGSGKSTLLNLVGGLDREYSGQIRVDGMALETMTDREITRFRNEKVGLVFQSFHLLDELTTEENVMLPTWFSRQAKDFRAQACTLLERVGLGHKIGKSPNRLSGGEKQRIAIARALIMKPKILLCDEPTGNLDEQTSEEIMTLFQQLHQEEGITLLLVTHDRRIAQTAQKIVELRNGCLEIISPQILSPSRTDAPPVESVHTTTQADTVISTSASQGVPQAPVSKP